MAQEKPPKEQPVVFLGPAGAAWFYRLLGFIIVGVSLAVGAKAADQVSGDEAWVFLHTAMVPLGIGFLILVAADVISRMGRR